MSYAVTNPATGETVRTYDTITDAELETAIAAADEVHRTWSKSTTVDDRAALGASEHGEHRLAVRGVDDAVLLLLLHPCRVEHLEILRDATDDSEPEGDGAQDHQPYEQGN